IVREVTRVFGVDPRELESLDLAAKSTDEIADTVWGVIKGGYARNAQSNCGELLRRLERDIMLQIVDAQWKDHLYSLDHLKEGIGLRGYGQRDPLVEYKKESFNLFQAMKDRVDEEIVRYLWWLRPVLNEEAPIPRRPAPRRAPLILNDPSTDSQSASVLSSARAPPPQPNPFGPSRSSQPQQPPRVRGDAVK